MALHNPRRHQLHTTSCQQIIHEEFDIKKGTGTVTIQSDLTHPKLFPVLTGHVMNGRTLGPSSLYGDMAMTVANHMYQILRPEEPEICLNVCAMEVHKTLMIEVPPHPDGQHLRMEATVDLSVGEVKVIFKSVTWDGTVIQEHGDGTVKYEDPTLWRQEWDSITHLVNGQITDLERKLQNGQAHKILRGLAYKIFDALVSYGPKYQGMESVILDKNDTTATATIKLQTTPGINGEFFCSPYNIDNLCHLSGFIVNAADVESAEPLVYISHGWESLKFLKPQEISSEKTYRSFVRMVPQAKNVYAGDVYILEGEEIIAVLYGLKFQGVPQKLMDVLLPPLPKVRDVGEKKVRKEKKVKIEAPAVAA
ncbi:hypothetical protein EJ08DRAFT_695687 [Tothia fuscella]|uniref:PKS/mFAS DH domain-containing protein n=1 Tax=Tothia fuscella TaxID=1048955 RepID=A0A9P4NU26_9PEZI|nr:hypothetical protein EJ08DRAFT_695687 [Tothia fuscella]